MSEMDERRASRIKTWFHTLHSSGRDEGEGVLTDISDTGALVEEITSTPRIGKRVRLLVCLDDRAESFELVGQVVRYTDSGFAIKFEKSYPILSDLIEEATTMVSTSEDS